MNVLKAVAQAIGCFVLGVDHFGKDLQAGTRGAYSKESSGDLVLACLGNKELSGSVTNTRLAVRKHRGGRRARNTRSCCGRWRRRSPTRMASRSPRWWWTGSRPVRQEHSPRPDDPWAKPKRQDQRTAALRLETGADDDPGRAGG